MTAPERELRGRLRLGGVQAHGARSGRGEPDHEYASEVPQTCCERSGEAIEVDVYSCLTPLPAAQCDEVCCDLWGPDVPVTRYTCESFPRASVIQCSWQTPP